MGTDSRRIRLVQLLGLHQEAAVDAYTRSAACSRSGNKSPIPPRAVFARGGRDRNGFVVGPRCKHAEAGEVCRTWRAASPIFIATSVLGVAGKQKRKQETEREKFMALVDHRMRQEAWAKSKQLRAMLPNAYGEYLSKLAKWDWFVTITFRDILPRDLAIARIEEWLADIQALVGGKQIGWILAEEFGRIGGRTATCWLRV